MSYQLMLAIEARDNACLTDMGPSYIFRSSEHLREPCSVLA